MTPESDPAKPQFLTVSEEGGELSAGESLVLELIRSGELPANPCRVVVFGLSGDVRALVARPIRPDSTVDLEHPR